MTTEPRSPAPECEPHEGSERLRAEIESLRRRVVEAEEMLAAIRSGEVDALVVGGPGGDRVYTLEGAETPYRMLVEQMHEGAIVVGAGGTILYSNRQFAELVGLPLERVIGGTLAGLVAPQDAAALDSVLQASRSAATRRELSVLGPAGRCVPVYLAASPMPADEADRICIIVTDLTMHKRTQELEDAKAALYRQAAALARSNADLANFAHVAAHDLKEPLRGIRHLVGFMQEDLSTKLGSEGEERLASLDRLTARMQLLLDSVLEYSRVGQDELRTGPCDLGQVLGDVLSGLATWLREQDARVSVSGLLPTLSCDAVLVGRLFQNLIVNGVKHNDSSPRLIEIGVSGAEQGRPVLYVRDNGVGIPAEHHASIFRMFKRLGRESRGAGSGAGLAVAQKIVERHGGRIWLESEPGRGTTFYFTLAPRATDSVLAAPGHAGAAAAPLPGT